MKPWKEVIDGIRNAVLGKEVREDLAQMGEYVEQFANTAGENIQKAIDPTLSVEGKAADAAKVGEAINTESERAKGVESQLKEDIENIVRGNVSLGKITNGYYLIKTNGNLEPYSGWSTTDYIDLNGVDKIYIDWEKASVYNCYYDKNKSYLGGVDIYDGYNIIEVIENARYIRLSNETTVLAKAAICFDTSGGYLLDNKVSKNEIIGGDLLRGYGWLYTRENALNIGYQAALSYYQEDPAIIPIFVSTDNHMYSPQHAQRHVNNLDKDGMEITNINLGDCVVDNWADGKFPEIYKNIRYIKNYIGVCGNHDKQDGTKTTEYYLNRLFTTTNYPAKHIKKCTRCCYSVRVDKQSVKYIVLDLYHVPEGGGLDVSMPTEVAAWLIDELKSDPGYDMILLNHSPFTSRNQHRDGSVQAWTDEHSIYDSIFTMLKDRKNKRKGTITDSDGVQHNYDFTSCKDDLLFILHGHAHEELYLIEDHLLSYICDWEGGKRNTFILYDRKLRRFIAFVVEETAVKEMLSLIIN